MAAELLDRVDSLVEEQLLVLGEFPGYDRIPPEALRSSARRNVLRVAAILEGEQFLPDAAESEQSSGRQRALQGIPAETVVGAYRAVMGVLREDFLATAERLRVPPAQTLAATRSLWDLTDRYATELIAARQQIDIDLARRDERARMAFLQRLLSGTLLPEEVVVGGSAYGLRADGEYWVARGRSPEQERHSLAQRLETTGAAAHFHPLIGWIDGDLVAVTARRPQSREDGCVLALSGPVSPAGFPQAFAEATRLLNVAVRYHRSGLVDSAALSVRIAVVEESELSEALFARFVTPVLAGGGPMAPIILDSVRSYLANRRHVANTAKALSVHVNTVRYRLGRYAELSGADLEDTETLIEVWWALESWALDEDGGAASNA